MKAVINFYLKSASSNAFLRTKFVFYPENTSRNLFLLIWKTVLWALKSNFQMKVCGKEKIYWHRKLNMFPSFQCTFLNLTDLMYRSGFKDIPVKVVLSSVLRNILPTIKYLPPIAITTSEIKFKGAKVVNNLLL